MLLVYSIGNVFVNLLCRDDKKRLRDESRYFLQVRSPTSEKSKQDKEKQIKKKGDFEV